MAALSEEEVEALAELAYRRGRLVTEWLEYSTISHNPHWATAAAVMFLVQELASLNAFLRDERALRTKNGLEQHPPARKPPERTH